VVVDELPAVVGAVAEGTPEAAAAVEVVVEAQRRLIPHRIS